MGILLSRPSRIALVVCDVVEFDRAVRDGRDADALRLYRGHFLEAIIVSGAYELMEWIAVVQRRRWEHLRWAAIRLAERAFNAGDTHAAVRTAQRVTDLLPGSEPLHQRLAEILHAYRSDARLLAT